MTKEWNGSGCFFFFVLWFIISLLLWIPFLFFFLTLNVLGWRDKYIILYSLKDVSLVKHVSLVVVVESRGMVLIRCRIFSDKRCR